MIFTNYKSNNKLPVTEPLNIKRRKALNRYLNCFSFYEEFEDRRFDKYVDKVKYQLWDYIGETYNLKKSQKDKMDTISDIAYFLIYYFTGGEPLDTDIVSDLEYSNVIESSFLAALHQYYVDEYFFDEGDFIDIFLCDIKNEKILFKFVEEELRNACKLYIAKMTIKDKTIEPDSYHKTLPLSDTDAIDMLTNIYNWVAIDIERFIQKCMGEDFFDNIEEKKIQDLKEQSNNNKKELSKANKTIRKQENTLKEKDWIIKQLTEKIEKLNQEEKNDKKELVEENEILARQNTKLKEKYNELLSKYKDLKSQTIETSDANEVESETEIKELDMNGRYVFVLKDSFAFLENVKDTFPNATFIETNSNAIDMVIIISSHIDHTTYYAIKGQCKTKGIPYIHCEHSNIELIKNMMWTHMEL